MRVAALIPQPDGRGGFLRLWLWPADDGGPDFLAWGVFDIRLAITEVLSDRQYGQVL